MSFAHGNRVGLLMALVLVCLPILTGYLISRITSAPPVNDSCPMFGRTIARNMANPVEKNIPGDWNVNPKKDALRNVKWSAKLGSKSLGGPVIAGGKIFVGTNNDAPRDPAIKGDKGVLMCFRESDGKFLWQAVHDKLPSYANDYPKQGVVSSPVVDGNRLYYVSNRCELVCAEVQGHLATGKARFLWKLDMIGELGVYPSRFEPCNHVPNGSPLVIGDLVCTVTGNGVAPDTGKLPAPDAPSFIAVDKLTGKVVWKDNSPGKNIMEGQRTNPCAAEVKGKMQVIVPGGDGWLRGFEASSGKLIWKFDCNPKKAVFKLGGRGDKSYFIATPVVYDNKVYIGIGQDPAQGTGVGHLWCIDISKTPANKDLDLSPVNDNFDPKAPVNKDSGLVWHFGGLIPNSKEEDRNYYFGRTLSTCAVHNGLCYAADLYSFLCCLDAKTGEKYWEYDTRDSTWSSPYYVDGKVFIGGDSGDLLVFTHGKEMKPPRKIDMLQALQMPPVAVNGVLYVTTGANLYAITQK